MKKKYKYNNEYQYNTTTNVVYQKEKTEEDVVVPMMVMKNIIQVTIAKIKLAVTKNK